jgi:nucleotide-binding universal stress UspA family protein
MKKILIPTDFSANSKHALWIAAKIACKTKASIEILHTNTTLAYAPPLPEYAGAIPYNLNEYYEFATKELYNLKNELLESFSAELTAVETRIEEGFLFSSINRVVEEDQADLIVMGTKGASGAVEFLIGSNTEKVIRTAKCPVLAIPESTPATFEPKKIVLPTTLFHDQLAVFQQLSACQLHFPFQVLILYMNNPAGLENNEEINNQIQLLVKNSGLTNVESNVTATTFNEEATILKMAEEYNADMVVMGTHQRRGLSHLLFGSLTEDAANHAKIPVLGVPIH